MLFLNFYVVFDEIWKREADFQENIAQSEL